MTAKVIYTKYLTHSALKKSSQQQFCLKVFIAFTIDSNQRMGFHDAKNVRRDLHYIELSKGFRFGLSGFLGAILGAVLGSAIFLLFVGLSPAEAPQPENTIPIDLVIVLDISGSMQDEIDGVRSGIQGFVSQFIERNLDLRVALIVFQDCPDPARSPAYTVDLGGLTFTTDANSFRSATMRLTADGGCDPGESSLDGIIVATQQRFRNDSTKVIMLITDEPPNTEVYQIRDALDALNTYNINQLHLVIDSTQVNEFSQLRRSDSDLIFFIDDSRAGRTNFSELFSSEIGADISSGLAALYSSDRIDNDNLFVVLILSGFQTALLAATISFSLVLSQNLYLRNHIGLTRKLVKVFASGAVAGLVVGIIAQAIFTLISGNEGTKLVDTVSRTLAWTVVGLLIGWAMTAYIPNMRLNPARLLGAIGGGVGALFFAFIAVIMSEQLGVLIGTGILGFAIGLAVVIAEALSRDFWLEIAHTPKQKVRVSLGDKAITVGSSVQASVYIEGLADIAYIYRLEEDQVTLEDTMNEIKEIVKPGHRKNLLRGISISVCSE